MIKERRQNSLSDVSMKMVANIIKLSSFSIAKMSLGTTGPLAPVRNHAQVLTGSNKVRHETLMHQNPGSLRSQKQHGSHPISFVVDPGVDGICEEKTVDRMASEYIDKVHAKIRRNYQDTPRQAEIVLPPPPPPPPLPLRITK